jgi:hypothetical protein
MMRTPNLIEIYDIVKIPFLCEYIPERDGTDPREAFLSKYNTDKEFREHYYRLYCCANGGGERGD